jgi:lipopolysaccharide/colanic/teichoic acid biosynthesis glycosyltransferase
MTPAKRLIDIALALLLLVALALPFLALLAVLLIRQGRPVFYLSERMAAPDRSFMLWKLRTMRPAVAADAGVSGGDKADRITPMGRFLRKYRLDEIPQLWNVLKGDMSFVGPRPPLRQYVERFPDLYARVLVCRPGITGLATLHFHAHEDYLLRSCTSAQQTDQVYSRRCVPRKARLDLIYRKRRNICLDVKILLKTAARVFRRKSAGGVGRS